MRKAVASDQSQKCLPDSPVWAARLCGFKSHPGHQSYITILHTVRLASAFFCPFAMCLLDPPHGVDHFCADSLGVHVLRDESCAVAEDIPAGGCFDANLLEDVVGRVSKVVEADLGEFCTLDRRHRPMIELRWVYRAPGRKATREGFSYRMK